MIHDGEVGYLCSSVLWGLGRSLAYEHPELKTTLLDVSPLPTESEMDLLVCELLTGSDETQVAYRDGQRMVARLARYQLSSREPAPHLQSNASYLITGGLGGLGLTIARALVEQGARHLVLSGRSGATSEVAQQTVAELEQQGATVQVVAADMAQRDDVAQLLQRAQTHAPLKGIIHAAGVLDDGILLQQTLTRYQTVAAPKVTGSWHLHTLTRTLALDFLVLFSSAASLLGSAGQANYAAANAFLDSLASARQAQGLPALSINWGAWTHVGLAHQRARAGHMQVTEATSMTPEQGTAVFQMLVGHSNGQVGVVPGLEHFQNSDPFFQELVQPVLQPTTTELALRQQLAQVAPSERRMLLVQHVQQQVGLVLGHTDEVPLNEGFFDLGMDSLMAVELRNSLQKSLECKLPGTLTFDYPTSNTLVTYLMQTVLGDLFAEPVEAPSTSLPYQIESHGDATNAADMDTIVQELAEELGVQE